MNTNSEPEATPPVPPKIKMKLPPKKELISIAVLFVIFVLASAYFVLAFRQNIWPFVGVVPSPTLTASPSYSPSPSESAMPSGTPVGYAIEVKWNDKLVKDMTFLHCSNPYEYIENCQINDFVYYYNAGKIISGELKDLKLYLKGGEGYFSDRVVILNNAEVKIENIKGISDLPQEINFPGTNYKLEKGNNWEFFSSTKWVKKLFYDDKLGDAYLSDNGCIVFELLDYSALTYDLTYPFFNKENGLLDLKLNNGQQNKEEYVSVIGACGAACFYYKIISEDELKPETRLALAGKVSTGEEFYEIKDPNDARLKELYEDKYTLAYYSGQGGHGDLLSQNKYTYEQFISYHPYLYWKDPLGRWIEFKNKRFDTVAEMCKPVIYLYPTEKTALNVKIMPNGGIYHSEPQYGNGWQIEAYPDGSVIDLKTGQKYDNLFWEGYGLSYPEISEGWVVKKVDLGNFLDTKLSYLGLNIKEISDFKDYWLAKLSSQPYYAISFLTKAQFDSLAPLEISPLWPSTLIRVMMTAQGLDKPISLPEQKLIQAPPRNGFTVVEWGGALLK